MLRAKAEPPRYYITPNNMPVNIYNERDFETIDFLCKGIWDLPTQVDAFKYWLSTKGINLKQGHYVADIGFDIRKDACSGGGIVDSESMRMMGKIGMAIHLSEYPGAIEK